MAFNGSPRKLGWNTVTLLENALEGAKSAGAETELVQLYDMNFKGCMSCLSCKRIDRKADGVCAVKDDLSGVLDRIRAADALIIGTPVYYGAESSSTRAFLERLCFPYLKYNRADPTLFPKRINTGLIYTMNMSDELIAMTGLDRAFNFTRGLLARHFGACELMLSTETLQFQDYSKYQSEAYDPEARYRRRAEVFPQDCKRAFELGARMVSGVAS